MAKGKSGHRRIASHQMSSTPYPLRRSHSEDVSVTEKCANSSIQRTGNMEDWKDAICSICMDHPHNAVLLLCASHEKGCRPYMCGTSCRFTNCFDQYQKVCTKVTSPLDGSTALFGNSKTSELRCPLCRSQVKGCTVVQSARQYLNSKSRNCLNEKCTFNGTYKELRKHVKAKHPSSRPREVDPASEQKWTHLQRQGEFDDAVSTIMSTMPDSMVFGDYLMPYGPYGGVEYPDVPLVIPLTRSRRHSEANLGGYL